MTAISIIALSLGAVAVAGVLSGASGFGLAVILAPSLLALGYENSFVVASVLALSFATRVPVAARLRDSIDRARVLRLLAGAVPGMLLGSLVLTRMDTQVFTRAIGVATIVAAILNTIRWRPLARESASVAHAAGFLGGFLGVTTSLVGVAPAIYLTRLRPTNRRFLADISGYFVVTSLLSLLVVLCSTGIDTTMFVAWSLWIPLSLLSNWWGTSIGVRLPTTMFRGLTTSLLILAGAATIAHA